MPIEASFEINRGRLRVDPGTYATNVRGVFAAGDVRTGAATVVAAIAEGRRASYAVDAFLRGMDLASILKIS